ncbi:hypothetical protein EDC01DRAFT_783221 [Geopyxis carbonaria]|nr:hypothetical protein EDC01DRAFT_783221 [Geopyxis carbonaria]
MSLLDSELTMPALPVLHNRALYARSKNWAQREPGVIVVFAIIATIVLLLTGLFVHRKLAAKKRLRADP